MKKKYIICIASVLFALIVCIWISYRHSKQYVFTYVQNHTDELTEYAEEIIETAPNHTLSYEAWDAEFYESTDMVQFMVSGWGLTPSTKYKGFFLFSRRYPSWISGDNCRV